MLYQLSYTPRRRPLPTRIAGLSIYGETAVRHVLHFRLVGQLFDHHRGSIGQHLGDPRRDFVGVVAHRDHRIGADLCRHAGIVVEGLLPRLFGELV